MYLVATAGSRSCPSPSSGKLPTPSPRVAWLYNPLIGKPSPPCNVLAVDRISPFLIATCVPSAIRITGFLPSNKYVPD